MRDIHATTCQAGGVDQPGTTNEQLRPSRRQFLRTSGGIAAGGLGLAAAAADDSQAKPVRVLVWDEQQPAQKQVYDHFLGNWLAGWLRGQLPGLAVQSAALNDPHQGLSDEVLDRSQVLLWWGHQRHAEITPQVGKKIAERIKSGRLALIALHSAHWSTPFVEAMNLRTHLDAHKQYSGDKVEIQFQAPPQRYTLPRSTDRITPYADLQKFPDDRLSVRVHLPYCCFPSYRTDGRPSQLRVLKPEHPIVRGLPARFELPHTEMYNEPFHVPAPDEVILEERWASGEWFRSGAIWKLGKGHVFYFRPGHETFAVYKEKPVLHLLENAVRWLAAAASSGQ